MDNDIKGNNNSVINGNDNVVIHGDININKKETKSVKTDCPPNSINEEQVKKINDLRNEVANIEIKTGMDRPKAYGKWMALFKKKFKLASYRCLPSDRFEDAVSWFLQEKAKLQPKLRRRDNPQWRSNKYKGIYSRGKELGMSKEDIIALANEKFNKNIASLKDLGEQNLEKLYRSMFAKKR